MYIVNWYPGSYGDRIIKDLFDLKFTIIENDTYILPYNQLFKFPETYCLSESDLRLSIDKLILPDLKKYNVIGAHRLNKFNFDGLINGCKVISIDPTDCYDNIIDSYFKKVHGRWTEPDNRFINQLLSKQKLDIARRYKRKLIENWQRNNIVESDIIFELRKYLEDPEYINWFKKNVMS